MDHINVVHDDHLLESDQLQTNWEETDTVLRELLTTTEDDNIFEKLLVNKMYSYARQGIARFMKLRCSGIQEIISAMHGFDKWTAQKAHLVQFRESSEYGGVRAWERSTRTFTDDENLATLAGVAVCMQSIAASEVSCERMISRQGFIYNGRNHNMKGDLFQARLALSYKRTREAAKERQRGEKG